MKILNTYTCKQMLMYMIRHVSNVVNVNKSLGMCHFSHQKGENGKTKLKC